MNIFRRFMVLAITASFLAGSALANPGDPPDPADSSDSTLEKFDQIEGRSYHARFYRRERCEVCHEDNQPVSFPADDACLDCHEIDSLVEETARPAGEEGQNPHDNLHYGTEVPCMECHGEHETRTYMCDGCHSFEYPNFKP